MKPKEKIKNEIFLGKGEDFIFYNL